MRGAVALHQEWLAKDSTNDIAVYVVWSPQLGAQEKHVASATGLVSDARALHYWDGSMTVGRAFQPLLQLSEPAWDVWMLFDESAVWKDSAPAPAWWEHQLHGAPSERVLDAVRFATKARSLR
jgi:hypothetical protein